MAGSAKDSVFVQKTAAINSPAGRRHFERIPLYIVDISIDVSREIARLVAYVIGRDHDAGLMESDLEPGVRKLPTGSAQAVDALVAQLDGDLADEEEEEDLQLWGTLYGLEESPRSVRSAWANTASYPEPKQGTSAPDPGRVRLRLSQYGCMGVTSAESPSVELNSKRSNRSPDLLSLHWLFRLLRLPSSGDQVIPPDLTRCTSHKSLLRPRSCGFGNDSLEKWTLFFDSVPVPNENIEWVVVPN